MSLDPDIRRLLRDWGIKIVLTAYLLFVFAFMASHPQPASLASLFYALTIAVVPAAIAAGAVLGVMVMLRKH